ncbi:HAD family hydrolase [Pseudalkalibacillus decolorationis]|uniref:HAD family hydrolase n=1 Tax=Pseudalkalibacillus decolorationis TaxID=163879 RepID=UPI002148E4B6|nr:HAD family hydrolase [Pseudalkalibacillus decolorationis]
MFSGIVLDLDGTLLNSNKEVTKGNLNAILSCHRLGVKPIIATARPPRSVKKFLPDELINVCAFVFYNGGFVVDKELGIEEHYPIAQHQTAEVLKQILELSPSCNISIEVKDVWYANKEVTDSTFFNLSTHPMILETERLGKLTATKILVSGFEENDLKSFCSQDLNIVVTDGGKLIQIMNLNVSKTSGISTLCKHFKIDQSSLIVFGDDTNDLDMFNNCGYTVAMGNAIAELKQIADEITETNDQDGVRVVLEKMILNNREFQLNVS